MYGVAVLPTSICVHGGTKSVHADAPDIYRCIPTRFAVESVVNVYTPFANDDDNDFIYVPSDVYCNTYIVPAVLSVIPHEMVYFVFCSTSITGGTVVFDVFEAFAFKYSPLPEYIPCSHSPVKIFRLVDSILSKFDFTSFSSFSILSEVFEVSKKTSIVPV